MEQAVRSAVLKIDVRRERTERRVHTLSTVRVTVAMMIDSIIKTIERAYRYRLSGAGIKPPCGALH